MSSQPWKEEEESECFRSNWGSGNLETLAKSNCSTWPTRIWWPDWIDPLKSHYSQDSILGQIREAQQKQSPKWSWITLPSIMMMTSNMTIGAWCVGRGRHERLMYSRYPPIHTSTIPPPLPNYTHLYLPLYPTIHTFVLHPTNTQLHPIINNYTQIYHIRGLYFGIAPITLNYTHSYQPVPTCTAMIYHIAYPPIPA